MWGLREENGGFRVRIDGNVGLLILLAFWAQVLLHNLKLGDYIHTTEEEKPEVPQVLGKPIAELLTHCCRKEVVKGGGPGPLPR